MKSWTEKLNAPAQATVKPAPISIAGMRAGEMMLVPTPHQIEAFIRAIPAGRASDVRAMRKALAKQNGAEVTCPITTGFHVRTVAEAACEMLARGAQLAEIAPFWRLLDDRSPTTGRLSCGRAFVAEQRAKEGLSG